MEFRSKTSQANVNYTKAQLAVTCPKEIALFLAMTWFHYFLYKAIINPLVRLKLS
jgi:hypothetical protein